VTHLWVVQLDRFPLNDSWHLLSADEQDRALLDSIRSVFPDFPAERVHQIPHHLAHAASAHLTSGWLESLVVVIDAMGEAQSVTVYRAQAHGLENLKEVSANDSIGIFYSLITLHLGFDFNADEYKIMGLAPYGDPDRFRSFFEQAVELRADGTVRIPALGMNRTREERENYLATRRRPSMLITKDN